MKKSVLILTLSAMFFGLAACEEDKLSQLKRQIDEDAVMGVRFCRAATKVDGVIACQSNTERMAPGLAEKLLKMGNRAGPVAVTLSYSVLSNGGNQKDKCESIAYVLGEYKFHSRYSLFIFSSSDPYNPLAYCALSQKPSNQKR